MSDSPTDGKRVSVSEPGKAAGHGAAETTVVGEPAVTFETFFEANYRNLLERAVALGATADEARDVAEASMADALRRWNQLEHPAGFVMATFARRVLDMLHRDQAAPRTPGVADLEYSLQTEAADSQAIPDGSMADEQTGTVPRNASVPTAATDEQFERLLDRSSLRTQGARALRARTPQDHIDRARGWQPAKSDVLTEGDMDIAAALRRVAVAVQAPRSFGSGERVTSRQRVRDSLRESILVGRLIPGSRLIEADVAARMRVSTTSVREALRDLAAEGLIRLDPARGAVVSGNAADARDLIWTRSSEAALFCWMLDTFVSHTAGVREAIVVSYDGLLMAMSATTERASAERLAAIVGGFSGLAGGTANAYGLGGLNRVVVDLADGYLLTFQLSRGPVFGVVADRSAELDRLTAATATFARSVGSTLTPRLIRELTTAMNKS
ncbi:GntR family transcriptional regulator [Asanoa siamensis]|uniref:HTH gntR-type domain-containing protein n=1 Tax=Asanoa siamensis TaxID=926357 RepID=A0ABQ4CWH5_9ACTN|nr:GntR family transcriptional regulator [Asanoa siamensis]GIF75641.1 hypothetical protein Asi02nite_51590 [Asanoa siamensis]